MVAHLARNRSRRLPVTAILLMLLVICVGAPTSSAKRERVPLSVIHPALQVLIDRRPDQKVPVIVQKVNGKFQSKEIAAAAGTGVDHEFGFINAIRMTVPAKKIPQLAKARGVRYIVPDGPVTLGAVETAGLQTVFPQVTGAATLWNTGTGLTGKGVTVAVVDSGVAAHPDFDTRVLSRWSAKSSDQADASGHGTHVAGIIAGRSADGHYIGVAPEANIVAVKTANDQLATSESGVVKALQWVYDNRSTYNIRIVNMSLSAQTENSYLFSPMAAAAEKLWQSGIVVIVAAGNRATQPHAMWYPPSNDPFLITVGALDDNLTVDPTDDSIAPFSSYGQTQNLYSKPDLVAPGRKILAPLAAGTAHLAQTFPDRVTPDGKYIRLSGTSMASPVVSGLAALLLERYPTLTPNQVKWALTATTVTYPGQPAGTAGAVDIQAALNLIANRKATGLPLGEANQGVIASPQVDLLANNVNWEGTDWAQASALMYEGAAYWDAAYWDAAYWDAAYWDAAYWDAAYWDAYFQETAATDDVQSLDWD